MISLWKVLRSNPSRAKQWIPQMHLAVMSRAKSTTIKDYPNMCFSQITLIIHYLITLSLEKILMVGNEQFTTVANIMKLHRGGNL